MSILTGTLNSIRVERAARIRDIEYIREMARDDAVDDRFFAVESTLVNESTDFTEAVQTVNSIPVDDGSAQEEISRILNADHDNITFDEMLGITD